MICAYCGTDLPDAAMFCGECGRAVVTAVAAKKRPRVSVGAGSSLPRWPSTVAEHQTDHASLSADSEMIEVDLLAPSPAARGAREVPDLIEPSRTEDPHGIASLLPLLESEGSAEAARDGGLRPDGDAEADRAEELYRGSEQEEEPGNLSRSDVSGELEVSGESDVIGEVDLSGGSEAGESEVGAELEFDDVLAESVDSPWELPAAAVRPASKPETVSVAADLEPEADPTPQEPSAESAGLIQDGGQDLLELARHDERCTQCNAELAVSDIFCGECGFVRRPAGAAAPRPRDTAAYDPFPWGRPRDEVQPVVPAPIDAVVDSVAPASEDVPVGSVPVEDVLIDDGHDDIEKTRIVDRTARGDTFVLQFSTGENLTVSGSGLIGRSPLAEPGEYFDSLVAIIDPGKSVSKTHLEFGQDGGAFWVSDRYSSNGTVVREPERPARRGEAGKRYRVVRGTRIDVGEQFFIVS